jgi:hypothetical protein
MTRTCKSTIARFALALPFLIALASACERRGESPPMAPEGAKKAIASAVQPEVNPPSDSPPSSEQQKPKPNEPAIREPKPKDPMDPK